MPFTDSELQRVKLELGYNLLEIGAEPFIGHSALFDVVQENLPDEVATTATGTVAAGYATITLASATGFATGDRVFVDVGSRKELIVIQNLASTSLSAVFKNDHEGTFQVILEGALSLSRDCLDKIEQLKSQLASKFGFGALKKVDEIEFYQSGGTSGVFGPTGESLTFWRGQLRTILFGSNSNPFAAHGGSGAQVALY